MMGRIQRQPAQVQVDFIRLCCKYWQKDGELSIEDAKIEAMDSYDALLKYKIIKEVHGEIVIDFLEEQFDSLSGKREQASKAGLASAEARRVRKLANDRSTTVQRNPTPVEISSTELNRVEKSREEETREENKEDLFEKFWTLYKKGTNRVPAQREWFLIDHSEYPKIIEHVPKYVVATPKFRKDAVNYLKDRVWTDTELPKQSSPKSEPPKQFIPRPPQYPT
jgi:hypothetical protein